jgi:hypothetical protein
MAQPNSALNRNDQAFYRGERVKVADEMPTWMRHFECGCEAIVDHSYRDMHGPGGSNQFSLLLLLPEPRRVAWYPAELLTLMVGDRDEGEAILQQYNGRPVL